MTTTANRLVVTGATGFPGSHCLAPLAERGFDVLGLYRDRAPQDIPGVRWVRGDVMDRASMHGIFEEHKPKGLLHIAWFVEAGGKYEEFATRVNTYWGGHWIKHPAQINLHGLPTDLVTKILLEAVEVARRAESAPNRNCSRYSDWAYLWPDQSFINGDNALQKVLARAGS